MIKRKKNVDKYNIDVQETGKYLYNNEKLLAHYFHLNIFIDTITKMYDFNNKEILEIGCGDGIYTLELAKNIKSLKIVATEPSEEGIISAKKTQEELKINNVIFDTLNVYDLKLDKKFDAILFNVVLHHLSDPEKAINMVSNSTNTIIIVEPNGYSPALKILEKFSKYHIEHEERSFFLYTIKKWLKNNSFLIKEYKFRAILPMFCPNWLARLLYVINPIFQSIPLLNRLSCGKVFIVANKIQTRPDQTRPDQTRPDQ